MKEVGNANLRWTKANSRWPSTPNAMPQTHRKRICYKINAGICGLAKIRGFPSPFLSRNGLKGCLRRVDLEDAFC